MPRWRLSAGVIFTCVTATGCSFVSSRPPPSAPEARTPKAAAQCGNVWLPVADTFSILAGATYLLAASRLEEKSRPKMLVFQDGAAVEQVTGPPTSNYDWLRIAGYITMAVFGASSIYGYYVETQCASLRRELAEKAAHPLGPNRSNPPTTIFGFTFRMTRTQAAQACAAKQHEWYAEDNSALCSPKGHLDTVSPMRLSFESGSLHQIAVLRHPPTDQLVLHYDQVYAALRAFYGAPQVERDAPSGSCSRSMAECLEHGEKLRGAVWHWPTETIELQPVWRDEQALVEERYTIEE